MKKKYIIVLIAGMIAVAATLGVLGPLGLLGNRTVPTGGNSTNTTAPPENTWISPGKIFVEGYLPGEAVEYRIQIYNGNPVSANFSVDYRYPDHVEGGYVKPSSEVRDWVWISNKKPTIGAHETYVVTIRLGMPSTGVAPGDKWEFWIGVIDKSQTGMVQVELCTRWLVTMS